MKVFITGYKGFIGRNLTSELKNWVGYNSDVLDKKKLTKQMRGCDAVIHLAGIFNGPDSNLIYKVNLVGTANVVQAMHENGIKKIIFASSVGAGERFYNAYDDSKFIAEKIVRDKSLETTVLRLSNLYGKDQKDKLIAFLLDGFKKGEVQVTGDGLQTRDLVYIDDVVDAIIKSLKVPGSKKPIDIGCGKSYSILKVVDIISRILNKKVKIEFVKFPNYVKDMRISEVNLYLAKKLLGYKPKYSLEEGLKKIISE
jgi:nucleoside-diphosphate-sugar epimerase